MAKQLLHGLMLLVTPSRAWQELNDAPYAPLVMAVYTGGLAALMLPSRTLGSWLLGLSLPWAVLEGMLFTLTCVGATLAVGLVLMPFARLARRRINDGHAMKLAIFSATPLWLGGVFQAIPLGWARTMLLLLTLGWSCFLLFRGLPRLFQTEPTHTLVTALVVSALWVLGLCLFTQIFLPLAFAP